jgi:hypothetical protein
LKISSNQYLRCDVSDAELKVDEYDVDGTEEDDAVVGLPELVVGRFVIMDVDDDVVVDVLTPLAAVTDDAVVFTLVFAAAICRMF